jgi:16S rRNA C1402 N4-methylase RsmH
LRINDKDRYRGKEIYVEAVLDVLEELFQEYGDKVTPKIVADRLVQKLRKQIPLHRVALTYTYLGFLTERRSIGMNVTSSPILNY